MYNKDGMDLTIGQVVRRPPPLGQKKWLEETEPSVGPKIGGPIVFLWFVRSFTKKPFSVGLVDHQTTCATASTENGWKSVLLGNLNRLIVWTKSVLLNGRIVPLFKFGTSILRF